MSLYYVQKLLYQLNRDPGVRKRFDARRGRARQYPLTDERGTARRRHRAALRDGRERQILMHYSALIGQSGTSTLPR
jgi:hypothetical protein